MTIDHYRLLGVAHDASRDEIRHAYRTLARALHPDVDGATSDMAAVNEAWRVLGDGERRSAYDAMLAAGGGAGRGVASPSSPPAHEADRSSAWAGRRPPTEASLGHLTLRSEREVRLHRLMVAFAVFCVVVAVVMFLVVIATPAPSGP